MVAVVLPVDEGGNSIDVALDDVSSEAVGGAHGALKVDAMPDGQASQGSPIQGLGAHFKIHQLRICRDNRQTTTVDRDAFAEREGVVLDPPRIETHAQITAYNVGDLAYGLNYSGEHDEFSWAISASVRWRSF
jgi:hypothetical protein